jgi:hypothetical protein
LVETSAKNDIRVQDAFFLFLEQFLRKRHEQNGSLKLHCLSLHTLKLEKDFKFRESTLIKKERQIKIVAKRKSSGTSSAPSCDDRYNSRNNETSNDTKGERYVRMSTENQKKAKLLVI